jgi:hypothetical protein
MNRAFKLIALLILVIAVPSAGPARADSRTPACLRSWPEVRYRNYGYDHIVHIVNECRARAFCAVSSDVNPAPIEVEVPTFGQLEVMTCRGCAAREFTPRLTCRFVS